MCYSRLVGTCTLCCKKQCRFQTLQGAPECTMRFLSLCDKLRHKQWSSGAAYSVFCSFRRNNCSWLLLQIIRCRLYWVWNDPSSRKARQEVLPGWCIPSQRRHRWWCGRCCQIAPPKQPAEESGGGGVSSDQGAAHWSYSRMKPYLGMKRMYFWIQTQISERVLWPRGNETVQHDELWNLSVTRSWSQVSV